MSNVAILDKTVCILLCVHLWSGRRRLSAEDLGPQARNLPPADLASLGSLKLCDPNQLTRLNSIKHAAERDLEKRCVRFLGGYATEETQVSSLVSRLQAHQARFEQQAQAFVDRLHTEIEAWIAQHPPWAGVIRKALPDPAYVRGRLQFAYQVFRVGVAADDHQAEVNQGLLEATGGLSGQLFREIEQEARTTWEKSFQGRVAVGQKALRPIFSLQQKLQELQSSTLARVRSSNASTRYSRPCRVAGGSKATTARRWRDCFICFAVRSG